MEKVAISYVPLGIKAIRKGGKVNNRMVVLISYEGIVNEDIAVTAMTITIIFGGSLGVDRERTMAITPMKLAIL